MVHLNIIASAGLRNIPLGMGNANGDTGRVFGVVKNALTSTASNETNNHRKTSEFSGVVVKTQHHEHHTNRATNVANKVLRRKSRISGTSGIIPAACMIDGASILL